MVDTLKEHTAIIDALENHKKEEMEELYQNHLNAAQNINLQIIQESK